MAITNTTGLPTDSDIQIIADYVASVFKGQYANIGIAGETETTTLAGLARICRNAIMGDGTTSFPGIANRDLQQRVANQLQLFELASRYDKFFKIVAPIMTSLDDAVSLNLPSGFNFNSTAGNRPFDLWMIRRNAAHASTPAAPTTTPTASAATGGAISQAGAVRIKFTHTGSSDWYESQPTAAVTQSALTGKNNAISVSFSGTVPTGAVYLNCYRQLPGAGSGDDYYFDQRIAVTVGAAYPTVVFAQADQNLRYDFLPPSWLAKGMMGEFAFLFALAYAASSSSAGAQNGFMTFPSSAFLSPENVCLNPGSGFNGLANTAAAAYFGNWIGGTGFAAGTIASANDATNIIQGAVGAWNDIQLRVTSVLNAGAVITNVLYSYYDATNPRAGNASPQSGTAAAPGTLSTAVGSLLSVGVTAGRLVTAVTGVTVGTASSGTIIFESKALRTI